MRDRSIEGRSFLRLVNNSSENEVKAILRAQKNPLFSVSTIKHQKTNFASWERRDSTSRHTIESCCFRQGREELLCETSGCRSHEKGIKELALACHCSSHRLRRNSSPKTPSSTIRRATNTSNLRQCGCSCSSASFGLLPPTAATRRHATGASHLTRTRK